MMWLIGRSNVSVVSFLLSGVSWSRPTGQGVSLRFGYVAWTDAGAVDVAMDIDTMTMYTVLPSQYTLFTAPTTPPPLSSSTYAFGTVPLMCRTVKGDVAEPTRRDELTKM